MKKFRFFTKILLLVSIFSQPIFAQHNNKIARVIQEYHNGSTTSNDVLKVLSSAIRSVGLTTKLTPDYKDRYIAQFLNQVKQANIQLDLITYQIAIKAFEVTKNIKNALMLFDEVKELGLEPDIIFYNNLIAVCVNGGDYDIAMDIFQEGVKNGIYIDINLGAKVLDFHIDKWFTKESIHRLVELKKVDPTHLKGISSSMLFTLLEEMEFQNRGLAGKKIIVGYHGRLILREAVSEFLDYYHYDYEVNAYGTFMIDKKRKFHSACLYKEDSCGELQEKQKRFSSKFASESLSYAAACSSENSESEPLIDSDEFFSEEIQSRRRLRTSRY